MDKYPDKITIGDAVHKITDTALNLVPDYGAGLSAIFNTIVKRPIEKRREKWLQELGSAVNDLQKSYSELTLEKLQNNELFISTLMQASQIALRTHKNEKLEALKNTVLNSAISISVDEDMQTMFLNFIDSFTIFHIKLLQFWNSPNKYKANYPDILETARFSNGTIMLRRLPDALFAGLGKSSEFHDQITNDLFQKGLLMMDKSKLNSVVACGLAFNSQTTHLGNLFVEFITNPTKKA